MESRLVPKLGSSDKRTRDRALRTVLLTWLPAQRSVSEDEMRKLWKGLFYATWHADGARVQAELVERLSEALVTMSVPMSVRYFGGFLGTVRREWPGIDRLRLDKFYLLVRRFIHSLFTMLKKNYYWDLDIVTRFMGVLEENAFFPGDKFLSNGVNYHIASVFLEELTGFLPLKAEVIEVIFKPFMTVMAKCQDKILVGKIKSNLFDELLTMGRSLMETKKSGEESVVDDKTVSLGAIGLKLKFSDKFYELGTSTDCLQGNRKVLLGLYEKFLRLEKDFASSGIDISIPDAMVDDEEEVPKLIPISGETKENGNGSDKPMKKNNKKDKKEGALVKVNKKSDKKKKKNDKDNVVVSNGKNSKESGGDDEPELIFNESVIANLQKQFEKVAEEVDNGGPTRGSAEGTTVKATVTKKRKRKDRKSVGGGEEADANIGEKSSEKSAKKVRFSMKNNLVWKPHSPMPPQSLRIPPSVTPRGSALKKGVPPGPIREMPNAAKKAKLKRKKARKVGKITPAVKRLRKLQNQV